MSKKYILVIGGTGFLGTNIIERLSVEYPNAVWYTTRQNIEDPFAINIDFQELDADRFGILDVDIVIHNAAYLPKPEHKQDPLCDKVNYQGLKHVFDMYKNVCKHFIFISSLSVYSGLKQSNITEDVSTLSDNDYGISKIKAEEYLHRSDHKCSLTILRPGTMYGKHQEDTRIIPFIESSVQTAEPFEVYQSDRLLHIINVSNVVEIISKIISDRIIGTFNLVTESLTKKQIAETINNHYGSKCLIEYKKSDGYMNTKSYDTQILDRFNVELKRITEVWI